MKARADAIIHREQAEYLDRLLPASQGIVAEMEADAARNGVPIADREVALFLEITARAMKAKRVLEIGMAIGYAVVHLARGMDEGGLIVTIEPNDEMIRRAEDYLTRARVRKCVRIERGYALEVIPRLKGKFDMIYLDAVKQEYSDYLEQALPLLRVGGVVVADNVLWGGQVAGKIRSKDQDASTKALREFNERLVNHPQLRAEVLSFGDGIAYAVKIK
ncbi:MAG TPA: O-methyltransferase [Pyrinomonadaceae bacterium]|nr:O-methyltransferase [Pyrinomonadaceae bacterium]